MVRGRGEIPSGETATVGVRSERMVASRDPAAQEACALAGFNCAPAEVLTKMYLGDQIQIVARLEGGPNVIVREQRAEADPALDTVHPGDGITVSWDESAPHVMSTAPPAAN